MKLHYKLYLFFTGVVLLPLLVVTVAASLLLERSGRETYENRISSALAAASAVISGEAQALAGDLRSAMSTADAGALVSGDTGQRTATLRSLMEKSGGSGAALADSSGKPVAVTGTVPAESPPMLSATVQVMDSEGHQWLVSVYRAFDTGALASVFSSQELDWGLLEADTLVLGSLPEGSQVLSNGGTLSIPPRPADGSADGFFQARVGETGMLASVAPVPQKITSRETALFTGVSDEAVGAASMQVVRVGVGLLLLVVILAGAMGYLLAHDITRPLRELNEAATAGIEGNLAKRVEVRSRDEIGNLAGTFNQMQASIGRYIADLEESRRQLLLALSYAGDILGSTTDRFRLMKTTAEAALLATGARGIWVETFESQEPPGHEAVSIGVPNGFFDAQGAEAAHRLSLELTPGGAGFQRTGQFNSDLEMEAYPMAIEGKVLGALVAIYDRGHPRENDWDRILTSLAVQAASALENVDLGDLQRMLAITDPMTGLYNFRYLKNTLVRELEKSRRYQHSLTVAIVDLDDFKQVNDTYGHLAGDALLKSVAGVLSGNVRGADLVARYGGEEFAVILPETTKEAAMGVMEKLRREVAAVVLGDYPEVRVTASIGVAAFPDDADSHTDLLAGADKALYLAKNSGKNRVVAV